MEFHLKQLKDERNCRLTSSKNFKKRNNKKELKNLFTIIENRLVKSLISLNIERHKYEHLDNKQKNALIKEIKLENKMKKIYDSYQMIPV